MRLSSLLPVIGSFGIALAVAAPASAADNAMKVCGARYQAAKAGKTLPAGETWGKYLASCRAGLHPGATAPMAAAPMASAAAKTTTGKTAAQAATHQRMQQCAAQWHADKAAGKVAAGQTWPRYWSACNARLKG